MAWQKGKQLQGGKYVIERELDRGGFGITYLAKTSDGQFYAIKTVNETVEYRRDFAKCQRDFFNEVQRLEKCRHQYIVRIEEVIQDGPLYCMVMEYISGENLNDKVRNGGVLSEAEALRYIWQIGEALIEVHNKGLLHRDVTPENIMLRGDESEAVLIDFGIAREFTPDVTQSHTEKRKDGFAPIEQYFRKRKRGAYTDVYGLAATLYFLLTGQRPISVIDRIYGRKDSLVPPKRLNPQISDSVNQAILQGMAIEAKDRPQSMGEWLRLLKYSTTIPWGLLSEVGICYIFIGWSLDLEFFILFSIAVITTLRFLGYFIVVSLYKKNKHDITVCYHYIELMMWLISEILFFRILFITGINISRMLSSGFIAEWVWVWLSTWNHNLLLAVYVACFCIVGYGIYKIHLFLKIPPEKYKQYFHRFQNFVILAGTSGLGLGLGWLLAQIFP